MTVATVPASVLTHEEPDVIASLRALIYHRVPIQACYVLGRSTTTSLDKVRQQLRQELEVNTAAPAAYIENALAMIDAAEAADEIARDVYGCRVGRFCRIATNEQRAAFDAEIARRVAELRSVRAGRDGR